MTYVLYFQSHLAVFGDSLNRLWPSNLTNDCHGNCCPKTHNLGIFQVPGVFAIFSHQLNFITALFLCAFFFFCIGGFFSGKVYFSAFFIKMCYFYNVGKNYCSYCDLLQFPYSSKFFCLTSLGILTLNYIGDYPCYYFTIIVTLNVTRRLEGYRYMLGRRNIAANDIVMCSV